MRLKLAHNANTSSFFRLAPSSYLVVAAATSLLCLAALVEPSTAQVLEAATADAWLPSAQSTTASERTTYSFLTAHLARFAFTRRAKSSSKPAPVCVAQAKVKSWWAAAAAADQQTSTSDSVAAATTSHYASHAVGKAASFVSRTPAATLETTFVITRASMKVFEWLWSLIAALPSMLWYCYKQLWRTWTATLLLAAPVTILSCTFMYLQVTTGSARQIHSLYEFNEGLTSVNEAEFELESDEYEFEEDSDAEQPLDGSGAKPLRRAFSLGHGHRRKGSGESFVLRRPSSLVRITSSDPRSRLCVSPIHLELDPRGRGATTALGSIHRSGSSSARRRRDSGRLQGDDDATSPTGSEWESMPPSPAVESGAPFSGSGVGSSGAPPPRPTRRRPVAGSEEDQLLDMGLGGDTLEVPQERGRQASVSSISSAGSYASVLEGSEDEWNVLIDPEDGTSSNGHRRRAHAGPPSILKKEPEVYAGVPQTPVSLYPSSSGSFANGSSWEGGPVKILGTPVDAPANSMWPFSAADIAASSASAYVDSPTTSTPVSPRSPSMGSLPPGAGHAEGKGHQIAKLGSMTKAQVKLAWPLARYSKRIRLTEPDWSLYADHHDRARERLETAAQVASHPNPKSLTYKPKLLKKRRSSLWDHDEEEYFRDREQEEDSDNEEELKSEFWFERFTQSTAAAGRDWDWRKRRQRRLAQRARENNASTVSLPIGIGGGTPGEDVRKSGPETIAGSMASVAAVVADAATAVVASAGGETSTAADSNNLPYGNVGKTDVQLQHQRNGNDRRTSRQSTPQQVAPPLLTFAAGELPPKPSLVVETFNSLPRPENRSAAAAKVTPGSGSPLGRALKSLRSTSLQGTPPSSPPASSPRALDDKALPASPPTYVNKAGTLGVEPTSSSRIRKNMSKALRKTTGAELYVPPPSVSADDDSSTGPQMYRGRRASNPDVNMVRNNISKSARPGSAEGDDDVSVPGRLSSLTKRTRVPSLRGSASRRERDAAWLEAEARRLQYEDQDVYMWNTLDSPPTSFNDIPPPTNGSSSRASNGASSSPSTQHAALRNAAGTHGGTAGPAVPANNEWDASITRGRTSQAWSSADAYGALANGAAKQQSPSGSTKALSPESAQQQQQQRRRSAPPNGSLAVVAPRLASLHAETSASPNKTGSLSSRTGSNALRRFDSAGGDSSTGSGSGNSNPRSSRSSAPPADPPVLELNTPVGTRRGILSNTTSASGDVSMAARTRGARVPSLRKAAAEASSPKPAPGLQPEPAPSAMARRARSASISSRSSLGSSIDNRTGGMTNSGSVDASLSGGRRATHRRNVGGSVGSFRSEGSLGRSSGMQEHEAMARADAEAEVETLSFSSDYAASWRRKMGAHHPMASPPAEPLPALPRIST